MVSPIGTIPPAMGSGGSKGVTIKVKADTKPAERDLQRLTKSVENMEHSMSRMAKTAKVAAAAFAGFYAVNKSLKGIANITDQMTNMENKLALVVGKGKEVNKTFLRLRTISEQTRSSVSSSADIFNKFGLALADANVSTEQLYTVTESIQKSIKLSGAAAASAEAAIIQLGQGMASGELRGEELNSVLEQAPRIAQAVAAEMGVLRGELRGLAKDGQITSKVVLNAMINQLPTINKEYENLSATTGDLAVIFRDELTYAIVQVDRALGISDGVQGKIKGMTKLLREFNDNFGNIALNIKINVERIKGFFSDLSWSVRMYMRETFDGDSFKLISDTFGKITGLLESLSSKVIGEGDWLKFDTISKSISEFMEIIGDRLIKMRDKISGVLSSLFEGTWVGTIITALGTMSSLVGDSMKNIGGIVKDLMSKDLDSVVTIVKDKFGQLVSFLAMIKDEMFKYLGEVFSGPRFQKAIAAMDKLLGVVSNFVVGIVGAFKDAWEELSAPSAIIPSIFQEGEGAIAGVANKEALDKAQKWVENFTNAIAAFFRGLRATVVNVWNEVRNLISGGNTSDSLLGGAGIDNILGGQGNDSLVSGIFDDLDFADGIGSAMNKQMDRIIGAVTVFAGLALRLGFKAASASAIAFAFAPEVLNSDKFQEGLRYFVEKMVSGIVILFSGEGDFMSRLTEGIKRTFVTIGDAVIDTVFPKNEIESAYVEGFTGVLASAAVIAAIGGGMSKLMIGAISKMFIPGSIFLLGFEDGGKEAGKSFAKHFRVAFIGALFVGGIASEVEEAVNSKIDLGNSIANELVKGFTHTGSWAAVGAYLGKQWGVGGLVGGAIIGGVAGAFDHAMGQSNVVSALKSWLSYIIPGTENNMAMAMGGQKLLDATIKWIDDLGDRFFEALRQAMNDFISWATGPLTSMFSRTTKGIMPQNNPGGGIDMNTFSTHYPGAFYGSEAYQGNAAGGHITGPGTGTSDSILSRLSNGEFVIRAAAVEKFGVNFFEALNSGMLPAFALGGYVDGNNIDSLRAERASVQAEKDNIIYENKIRGADNPNYIPRSTKHLDNIIVAMSGQISTLSDQAAARAGASAGASAGNSSTSDILSSGSDGKGGSGKKKSKKKEKEEELPHYTDLFSSALHSALVSGDVRGAAESLMDSITSDIVSSFTSGIGEQVADMFDWERLLGNVNLLGGGSPEKDDKGVEINPDQIEGLFDGLFKNLSGMFSGGGGAGGLFSLLGGFLGFDQGGDVPMVKGAQAGKDSIKALLKPGERVLSRNEVRAQDMKSGKGSTTVNLGITGDISRQTKQEVMSMIPVIARAVNNEKKEYNF